MTILQQLEKLAEEKGAPCLSISLNTHRTFPDSTQDAILLKKLKHQAEEQLIATYGKRMDSALLENLRGIEIDPNHNLDSLHIFISNNTLEIVKLALPTTQNKMSIGASFEIRDLIQAQTRTEEYMILLLSQTGTHLYKVINDEVIEEVREQGFPFPENAHFNDNEARKSDSKLLDDLLREYFNAIDKALTKVQHSTKLNTIVLSTENNYSQLMQVADNEGIYLGHAKLDYNHMSPSHLAKQGFELLKALQLKHRKAAIEETKEAVGQGNVLTDLQEIYTAANNGQGDLLMVYQDFSQAVRIGEGQTLELVDVKNTPGVIDDITSEIAWQVLSKKGRVYFTNQEEIKDLGQIVLKTRY